MLLSNYVKKENIILDFSENDKNLIIKEMAEVLANNNGISDKDNFVEGVIKREEVESTAIGNGIAIPHTRGDFCHHLTIGIGRSKNGLDFNAIDGKPVHLIFMIAAPESAKKEYLQIIAKIARFLKSEKNRKSILEAESEDAIIQAIGDFDARCPGVERIKTKDGRVIYKEM
jgi:fructose-specific phosphotransferase system IIA component